METGTESNIIVLRLNDGENLIKCLEDTASGEGFDSAIVLSGIGMLRGFTLGYYKDGAYQRKQYDSAFELTSLQGSFAKSGGEMIVHLHGTLADSEHKAVGGHVFGGTVNGLAEITILKLTDLKLVRELNEETNLKELHIR